MSKFGKVLAVISAAVTLAVPAVPMTSSAAEIVEYPSGMYSYRATIYTEKDGKFEGGAEYHYNPETKGLVIDGNGSFTIHDFNDICASFDIDYTVVCKDVIVPENDDTDKPVNTFVFAATLTADKSEYVFTYKGSDMEKKYNDMMDLYDSIGKEGNRNVFVLDLLEDDTDPYTFTFTPEEPERGKMDGFASRAGVISLDKEHETCIFYEYYEHSKCLWLGGLDGSVLNMDELIEKLSGCDIAEVEADGTIAYNGETDNEKIAAMVLEILSGKEGMTQPASENAAPTEATEEATEETINWLLPIWEKVTLKGDADLDGVVDLSDVTVVAKYALSHNLYPLDNDVAYVNADMNQDGDINSIDTCALIEINLGKKTE